MSAAALLLGATRTEMVSTSLSTDAVALLRTTVGALQARVISLVESGSVEAGARRVALTTGFCMEAMLLAETAAVVKTKDAAARFATFTRAKLSGPLG